MIIPSDCWRNTCTPCHIFMTDYLKRGSLTVISAMTFTECLCGTERHGRECGRAQVNGFLPVIRLQRRFCFIYFWRLWRATHCSIILIAADVCFISVKTFTKSTCSLASFQMLHTSTPHIFFFTSLSHFVSLRGSLPAIWRNGDRSRLKSVKLVALQRRGQVKMEMMRTEGLRDLTQKGMLVSVINISE